MVMVMMMMSWMKNSVQAKQAKNDDDDDNRADDVQDGIHVRFSSRDVQRCAGS